MENYYRQKENLLKGSDTGRAAKDLGHFRFYFELGKYQKSLSKLEQHKSTKALKAKKELYLRTLLELPKCRQYLYKLYDDRKNAHIIRSNNRSIAKLGIDFNSSVKGKNKQIRNRIVKCMDKAMSIEATLAPLDWPDQATKNKVFDLIVNAQLSPELYLSNEMKEFVLQHKGPLVKKLEDIEKEISELREKLVRCVMQAVSSIAYDIIRDIQGDVVSYADAQQEALLLAHRYTLFYDPDRQNVEHGPAKWSSYCYSMVQKGMRNWLPEVTRTVSVPRSSLDRFRIVKQAQDVVGSSDLKLLTAMSNKLLLEKKDTLTKYEVFSPKEITTILRAFDSITVSLDTEGEVLYTAESVGADTTTPEDRVVSADGGESVRSIVYSILHKDYKLFAIKTGLWDGKERTVSETTEYWNNDILFSKPLSKAQVMRICKRAQMKLIQHKDEFEELR